MDALKISKSNRDQDIAVYNNFMFTKHRAEHGKVIWRCRDRKCHGRIHTVDGDIVRATAHNHVPSPRKIIASDVNVEVKKRAVDTMEQPRQIFQHVTGDVPVQAASKLSSYKAIQHKIERVRKVGEFAFPNPTTLAEIQVSSDMLRNERDGKDFLLHDSGMNDPNRFIVLATEDNLKLLHKREMWFGDGTFKVCVYHILKFLPIS